MSFACSSPTDVAKQLNESLHACIDSDPKVRLVMTLGASPVFVVLKEVSMVGNDMMLDPGIGTCGKAGQGVPVGVAQPSILINKMTLFYILLPPLCIARI